MKQIDPTRMPNARFIHVRPLLPNQWDYKLQDGIGEDFWGVLIGSNQISLLLTNELGHQWACSARDRLDQVGATRNGVLKTFDNATDVWTELLDKVWVTEMDGQQGKNRARYIQCFLGTARMSSNEPTVDRYALWSG